MRTGRPFGLMTDGVDGNQGMSAPSQKRSFEQQVELMNDTINIPLTPDELRYLISCGPALLVNIPQDALPTYCRFDKAQIIEFSMRMRARLDEAGYDM